MKLQIISAYAVSALALSALAQGEGRNAGTTPQQSVDASDVRTGKAVDDSHPGTGRDANDKGYQDADNTGRNVRDRDDQTLTPLDQGDSEFDVGATASIRKSIMDTKNLSVKAQNIKIITRNGNVTLRGPVDSAEEKRIIGEIAGRVTRPENVDNQLEVVLETSSK